MKKGKRKKKRKETGKRESYKYYEIGRIVLAGKEGKRGEPEKRKREKKTISKSRSKISSNKEVERKIGWLNK